MARNESTNDASTAAKQGSQLSATSPSPRVRALMKSRAPGIPVPTATQLNDEAPETPFHTPASPSPTDWLDRIEKALKLGVAFVNIVPVELVTAPVPPMVQTINQQNAGTAADSRQQHPSLILEVIQQNLDTARQALDDGVEPDVLFPDIERAFSSLERLQQQLDESPDKAARPAETHVVIEGSQVRKASERAWATLGDLRQKRIEESRKALEGSKGKGKKEKAIALINLVNSILKALAK